MSAEELLESLATQTRHQFRIRSDKLFLTFPQCETPLKYFCAQITQHFAHQLAYGVCSREEHADGNHHLHAAICLKAKLTINDPHELDVLVSPIHHGNYCGRFKGGVLKAFNYVMKEGDYLPLPFADPPRFDLLNLAMEALKKVKKTELVLGLIQAGAGLDELDDIEPSFVMTNLVKLQNYFGFRTLKARRQAYVLGKARKLDVRSAPGSRTLHCERIASWLNLNVRQPRTHRQKQLWIKSPPGSGKTSMILMLEEAYGLSIYYWPKDEKWWDGYDDNAYDFIVLDEYKAQKKITELNPVLSGDPVPVSRRNRPPIVKRDNLPVIVLSNFTPSECYHKASPSSLAPLLDRLTIVELPPRALLRFEFHHPVPPVVPEPDPQVPELPPGLTLDDLFMDFDGLSDLELTPPTDQPEKEEPGESIEALGLIDDFSLSEEDGIDDLDGFVVEDHFSDPDQDPLIHFTGDGEVTVRHRNPRGAYDPDYDEAFGLAHDYVWSKEVSVPLKKTDRGDHYASAPFRR